MTGLLVTDWSSLARKFRVLGQTALGCGGLAVLTAWGLAFRANLPTMSLLFLLVVVAVAVLGGFWSASLTSLAAIASLDYCFSPPIFNFNVEDPQDWLAIVVFEITALVISRLSAKELRNAREAARHRAGMEQLYELSRSLLLLDLHRPPGAQLVVLIHRIFGVAAVAIFDMNLGVEDRIGNWAASEQNLAKECYLRGSSRENSQAEVSERVLYTASDSVGALVIRGNLNPLVVDGLASLTAVAMDRCKWFEKEEKAEAARQSEQLRSAVMDALAHEFKTPLTAVHTSSSGLLELGGLTEPQLDLVTLIDDEVVRLNDLCTKLLLTAKLERGQVGLDTEEVNVQQLIKETLAQSAKTEAKRFEVVVGDPALTVRVDRGLLAMILTQYIENAQKYSTPHTPITIAAHKSRSEVLISVHNLGSTVRMEDRERVFDRFYRSADLKDAVAGTGIGLSIVRKAAEAHHGHVWVVSGDTEGTTFFLSIPIEARSEH